MAKNKSIAKRVLIGIVVLLIAMQFIHPAKNESPKATSKDITAVYRVPDTVQVILQKACYDCHSDNTRYPWYYNAQPVAWWMNDHIQDAKEELDFSSFGGMTIAKQVKKLRKSAKEAREGEMPLASYTWMHKDAILTEQEKNAIENWANRLADSLNKNGGMAQ